MTDQPWRPLGFDHEQTAATYDALHDGIPAWMRESFWRWMTTQLTVRDSYGYLETKRALILQIERVCRISFGGLVSDDGEDAMTSVRFQLERAGAELRVADYLVRTTASDNHRAVLDLILKESGSLWTVGKRSSGIPGLVRRVPEGVQTSADAVMASSGAAGAKLVQAWEGVYGISPDPSNAYALAVRAVEDALIPVVVPKQAGATLGHVIGQLKKDGDWALPLTREDDEASTTNIVLAHCRALWKGHHDRHGGVPGAGPVTQAEAEVAVSLAVSLVQWFTSGMAARR